MKLKTDSPWLWAIWFFVVFVVAYAMFTLFGCAPTPPQRSDIDWRPQMLETGHKHTDAQWRCCRYKPLPDDR